MTARILVVDDIAANLRLLEARLNAEYYEVMLASSGPEALARAADWMPDVILLDVMMPGMDGYEVCRRLKANPDTAHIPVVMITALVDPAERVRGLEAGADDFLSKPVDHEALFARLRALLRVKQVLDAFRLRAETARDLGFTPQPQPSASLVGAEALLATEDVNEAELLASVLSGDGINIRLAPDSAAAWTMLAEGSFDLALLSLSLDGGTGLRLASRLRAQAATRDLPVLLIADADQRDLVLRGFDLGANEHVLRPVDPNELRARARNQIRRKRYQERLQSELTQSLELAVTDGLTGLRNRRYITRHLEGLLRAGSVALLMLDVDRFKTVNDTYGHAAGDRVLQDVTQRMRQHLRAVDVMARFGGEEFVVAMAGAGEEEALQVAERLRGCLLESPVRLEPQNSLEITASIGVAISRPGDTPDDLTSAADAALYRAKANGRNRVELARQEDWRRRSAGVV
ncbi:PleD family two-component system response regulator [Roseomonas marmotae]|uniref:diguanylate cyclase n=1 Tax=Roseomonas marmotae TaxID=2768161 RepID=A0ABS3KD24_9PROT|nr:PleD family two-component system response regulator [Roseomonas marmotae]MBO1075367.1 PleD family two-component system response regulator [Roseomonas marmotae]QTI78357.1 PleD family two-component system response regulator [Roseomonas marmotae]